MKLFSCALVALALLAVGCKPTSGPETLNLSGAVHYTNGTPASHAKVWTDAGASAFTDISGEYHMTTPVNGPVITIQASDGYNGGAVVGHNTGKVQIATRNGRVNGDIVLDVFTPI